jgi:hypothetical protein
MGCWELGEQFFKIRERIIYLNKTGCAIIFFNMSACRQLGDYDGWEKIIHNPCAVDKRGAGYCGGVPYANRELPIFHFLGAEGNFISLSNVKDKSMMA